MMIPRSPLHRRHLLRGCGAAVIGLPLMEAMESSFGRLAWGDEHGQVSPKRFVAICATLGFHGPHLFPSETANAPQWSPYLLKLADNEGHFTLFSGLSHPEQQGNNGHASELTWLTAAKRPGLAGFRNSISLDQLIAEKIGTKTRYPYLSLSTSGRSLSWSSSGVEIPAMASPSKLFTALFIDGSDKEVSAEIRNLKRGRSILDTVRRGANRLENDLGQADRQKLDEYLTAVRDLERRLQQSEGWVRLAKPKVSQEIPVDITDKNDAIAKQRLLYDMIILALQTDSTRTITYQLSGMNAVPTIAGVNNDWHGLSHHGKDPKKIEELKIIEEAEFIAFNDFLNQLRNIQENGKSLLDHTAVLFGSNLGNASAHDWHNLPIVVAGGGYQHGHYVAHNGKDNTPLANLFVDLAQRMGVEIDQFGSSTAAGIDGLIS